MARPEHETSRDAAVRATHDEPLERPLDQLTDDVTDSGLGLSPGLESSLVDQPLLTDPLAAAGSQDDIIDPAADGDAAYVPPVDPVIAASRHGEVTVPGGFTTSAAEEIAPRPSSDGRIGDEALVDAVQSALRHDAATTNLDIEVTAEQGVVRLRGRVPGLEDAENAEEVAGRVEGVAEVVEELQVSER